MSRAGGRDLVVACDVLLPTPLEDSGSLRAVRLLELLRERHDVAFLPASAPWNGPDADRLRELSIAVPSSREAQISFLTENRDRVKWVQIARPSAFVYWYPLLAPIGVRAPIVYDSVDAHFVRETREAEMLREVADPRWFAALAGAVSTRAQERLILEHCDVVIAVSDDDAAALRTLAPDVKHVRIANIATCFRPPSRSHDGTVVFVGPALHAPNVGAVRWIVDSIAPAAARAGLPFQFVVIGTGWDDFATRAPRNVSFPGWVEDLEPWYSRALAAIAPLRTGAGVKGKVSEAAAHACPVVGTGIAFEGMGLESPADVLRAETTDDFLAALTRLHDDPELRATVSANAAHAVRTAMGITAASGEIDRLETMIELLATSESRK